MKKFLLNLGSLLFISLIMHRTGSSQNFGTALKFDGANDYVEIPNNSNFLEPVYFTMEVWFKKNRINSPSGKDRIMISVANNGWGLGFNSNNKMFFTKTGVSEVGMDTALADTSWHHVAVTHNGSTTSFYLGGQLESVKSNNKTFSSTGKYTIASRGSGGEFFQGDIDEIRIWNVVRTQQEIENNLCAQLNGNEAGLIAYYKFNDAAGDSLADMTSNQNNGALKNMDTTTAWVNSGITCTVGIIPSMSKEKNIRVYPNPFSSTAIIELSGKIGNHSLVIFDILGNEMRKSVINRNVFEIERGNLPNGIYFFQLSSGNEKVLTGKLIIQ